MKKNIFLAFLIGLLTITGLTYPRISRVKTAGRTRRNMMTQIDTRLNVFEGMLSSPEKRNFIMNLADRIEKNKADLSQYDPAWFAKVQQRIAALKAPYVKQPVQPGVGVQTIALPATTAHYTKQFMDSHVEKIAAAANRLPKNSATFKELGQTYSGALDFWKQASDRDVRDLSNLIKKYEVLVKNHAAQETVWMKGYETQRGQLSELLKGPSRLEQQIHDQVAYWLLYDLMENPLESDVASQRMNRAHLYFGMNFNQAQVVKLEQTAKRIQAEVADVIEQENAQELSDRIDELLLVPENVTNGAMKTQVFEQLKTELFDGQGAFQGTVAPDKQIQVASLMQDLIRINSKYAKIRDDLNKTRENAQRAGIALPTESTGFIRDVDQDSDSIAYEQRGKGSPVLKLFFAGLLAATVGYGAYETWKFKKEKGIENWSDVLSAMKDDYSPKKTPLAFFSRIKSFVTGKKPEETEEEKKAEREEGKEGEGETTGDAGTPDPAAAGVGEAGGGEGEGAGGGQGADVGDGGAAGGGEQDPQAAGAEEEGDAGGEEGDGGEGDGGDVAGEQEVAAQEAV